MKYSEDPEICEPCEVQIDLAEGENYIAPINMAAIDAWHASGHIGEAVDYLPKN